MKNSKVKVHLQKKNYHTVPVFNEIYICFDHLSLHILHLCLHKSPCFPFTFAGLIELQTFMVCLERHAWKRDKKKKILSGSERSEQVFFFFNVNNLMHRSLPAAQQTMIWVIPGHLGDTRWKEEWINLNTESRLLLWCVNNLLDLKLKPWC